MVSLPGSSSGPIEQVDRKTGTAKYSTISPTGDLTLAPTGDIVLDPTGGNVTIDADLDFQGAQSITTSSGNLSIVPAGSDISLESKNLMNVGTSSSDWDNTSLRLGVDEFIADAKGLVSGHTSRIAAGFNTTMLNQFIGANEADCGLLCARFANNSGGGIIGFTKSRSGTVGTNNKANDDDYIGQLIYFPADGVDFLTRAATFNARVDDGTRNAGDIGMAFTFEQMPGGQGVDSGTLAETFRIAANGNVTGTHGDYHVTSDERLKQDVVTITDALAKVNALRGVNFRWKDADKLGTDLKMGLIAQEVEAVVPEVVHTQDNEQAIKSVEYPYLVGLLIEAVKELKAEVDALPKGDA
jgi:hypothetical protein